MCSRCVVAPYVGAWIETHLLLWTLILSLVAPYVGAWIETSLACQINDVFRSHPTWVRGLKRVVF